MKYWVLMGGELNVWGEPWSSVAGLGDKGTIAIIKTERKAESWSS